MFDYAVGNWVVVTHGNQRFSGFTEDETVKILHFLPCKQEVLQKKLIKLPFLIVKWTSFLSVLRIFVLSFHRLRKFTGQYIFLYLIPSY